jgi:sporulation protein YlmC with PRC-barrel domain
MLYTEVVGRKVVSTASATTIGTVQSLVLVPGQQRAVALSLGKVDGPNTMLPWPAITAFGTDAVTVPGVEALVSDEQLTEFDSKPHAILRKKVLTTEGYAVGTVSDVEFDPSDGRIVSLVLDSYRWDGSLLIGVGSYAVIVRPQEVSPGDVAPH